MPKLVRRSPDLIPTAEPEPEPVVSPRERKLRRTLLVVLSINVAVASGALAFCLLLRVG